MRDNTLKEQLYKKRGALTLLLGILLMPSGCQAVNLEEEIARWYVPQEQRARQNVVVSFWGASVPPGYFLLVRKGPVVCALRFTEFHREGDATQPTIFYSGDPSLYASYEWYAPEEGSSDFTQPTVKVGQGQASSKKTVGLFRMQFPRGHPWVQCGDLGLQWDYPNHVGFSRRSGGNIEFAPTKWREISEVNPRDPRLTWYRYDEQRKKIEIPVDKLW